MKKMQCEFSSKYLQEIFFCISSEQLDIYLRNSYWGGGGEREKEGNIEYLAFPLISLFSFGHPGQLAGFYFLTTRD